MAPRSRHIGHEQGSELRPTLLVYIWHRRGGSPSCVVGDGACDCLSWLLVDIPMRILMESGEFAKLGEIFIFVWRSIWGGTAINSNVGLAE